MRYRNRWELRGYIHQVPHSWLYLTLSDALIDSKYRTLHDARCEIKWLGRKAPKDYKGWPGFRA